MPNMSYCRFRNTLMDFQDCASVLESGWDEEERLDLSSDERAACVDLILAAQDLVLRFVDEAGIGDAELEDHHVLKVLSAAEESA